MKKIIILMCIAFLIPLAGLSPANETLYIQKATPIQPLEHIWLAVCMVESSGNPLAYNSSEKAVGIAQIRQIRITDFNKQTGKSYQLKEMYDPKKSKEVFMFFALKIGEENTDIVIRKWNGSGRKTYEYLAKVKKQIK